MLLIIFSTHCWMGLNLITFLPLRGCEGMMCMHGGIRRLDRKGWGCDVLPFSLAEFPLKQVTDGGTVSEQ